MVLTRGNRVLLNRGKFPPLFRGIDIVQQTLDILPAALDAMRFRTKRIQLDPAIYAAEEANRLAVSEGISFREAYRRVAAKLKGSR